MLVIDPVRWCNTNLNDKQQVYEMEMQISGGIMGKFRTVTHIEGCCACSLGLLTLLMWQITELYSSILPICQKVVQYEMLVSVCSVWLDGYISEI